MSYYRVRQIAIGSDITSCRFWRQEHDLVAQLNYLPRKGVDYQFLAAYQGKGRVGIEANAHRDIQSTT